MLRIVILVCLAVCSQTFEIGQGDCPAVTTQRKFIQAFMRGEWFEVARYFVIFQGQARCTTWDWTNNPDGSATINFEGINLLNQEIEQEYTFQTSPDRPGELEFNEGPFRRATFKVLGTDYTSFAVVYACEQVPFSNINTQSLWVLSRRRAGFNYISQQRVLSVLRNNGIDSEPLNTVNQQFC